MTTTSAIRANLKRLILREYPSVEKFAHEHGLDKSTLSRILGGKREPKISTLLKIAQALNVGLDAICGLEAALAQSGPDGDFVLKCGGARLVARGESAQRLRELTESAQERSVEVRIADAPGH